MRRTALPLLLCLALTAGTVWSQVVEPVTVPAGGSLTVESPHGFHGQTITHGQDSVTLTAIAEIEGVAVCDDHSAITWHPLVKRDAQDAITCTYGHEHHADPNSVNDLFGPPGAWFGQSGQAISYPWQTSSQVGLENHVKHEGYKWYVNRDAECRPFWGPPNDGCFRSWRILVHTLGTTGDVTVRFHSFSIEAVIEKDGVVGIVRHGGWMDTGHLSLLVAGGSGLICPPMTSNPETFTCGSGVQRRHNSANVPPPHTAHAGGGFANWYATHQVTSVGPQVEEWGPVDYADPAHQIYHAPALKANNSYGRIENMSVNVDWYKAFLRPFADANAVITFSGYTDQHGVHAPTGCEAPTPACVPLVVDAVKRGQYLYNAQHQGGPNPPDHDVMSPVTGGSLVRFPN